MITLTGVLGKISFTSRYTIPVGDYATRIEFENLQIMDINSKFIYRRYVGRREYWCEKRHAQTKNESMKCRKCGLPLIKMEEIGTKPIPIFTEIEKYKSRIILLSTTFKFKVLVINGGTLDQIMRIDDADILILLVMGFKPIDFIGKQRICKKRHILRFGKHCETTFVYCLNCDFAIASWKRDHGKKIFGWSDYWNLNLITYNIEENDNSYIPMTNRIDFSKSLKGKINLGYNYLYIFYFLFSDF